MGGESEIRSRGERPGFDSGQNVWGRSSARFPLGRADARVWTPCLSVIGSRPFHRFEAECQNEIPTMTSAGPDEPSVRTEEVRIAPVRVPDFG